MFAPELRHHGREMRIMLACALLGFLFHTLSFWSDTWWYTFNHRNKFRRCGPWIFCFTDYIYPRDYRGKVYNGCWYVFVKEYWWLHDLLLPDWFIAFQVFEIITCFANAISLLMIAFTYVGQLTVTRAYKRMKSIIIVKGIETVAQAVACVVFGVYAAADWHWMPMRMDNLLGWGFGLAVIGNACALAALIAAGAYAWRLHDRINRFLVDDDDNYDDKLTGVKVTSMAPTLSVLNQTKPSKAESQPLTSIVEDTDVLTSDDED